MQFEDFDCGEAAKCNCQLLQTVQNLVNKYRSVIAADCGSQCGGDDRLEGGSSRPSTICGAADASPEYAASEASCARRQSAAVSSPPPASEVADEPVGRRAAGRAAQSPVRIVRIPNGGCPVHWRIDERYFKGTGSALQLNCDTISVTNCWQGLRLTGPPAEGGKAASIEGSRGSAKIGPAAADGLSLGVGNRSATSAAKFVQPYGNFVAWALAVVVCGMISFVLYRAND